MSRGRVVQPHSLQAWIDWATKRPNGIGVRRREARDVIAAAVIAEVGCNPTDDPYDADKLIALVDAAYPFGQRRYHPYRMWLVERKTFIQAIGDQVALAPPTAADYGAWEVAIDLVLQADDIVLAGGKADDLYEQAREILDTQAPRRLNRVCGACGAGIAVECMEAIPPGTAFVRDNHRQTAIANWPTRVPRVVPHENRVLPPGRSPAESGPLFCQPGAP